jgi:hypothetical protein
VRDIVILARAEQHVDRIDARGSHLDEYFVSIGRGAVDMVDA